MPLSVLGDERLGQLVGEENERAFAVLFSRYHQPLYRYIHSMLRHEADAQDALQSTFTAALVALRRRQRDAPLRPWLFRIAHNESVSLLRRRRPGDELSDTMPSPMLTTEAAAEERHELGQLVSDLKALPERQRGALVMRELNGLSHEDLAQALGISAGAAKQTVFEARRALQDFAEGRAMACEEIQRLVSDGDRRALRGRKVRAHLRGCSGCAGFAAAIPVRREALMALSPTLPTVAASGLLARILHTGSSHHGGGGGLLASATGKSLGLAVSAKTLATGVAIVAAAAAGVGAVDVITHSGHSAARTRLVSSSGHGRTGSGTSSSATAGSAHSASQAAGSRHNATRHSGSGGHTGLSHRGHGGSTGGTGTASHTGTASRGAGNAHSGGASQGQSSTGQNSNAHGANPNAGGGSTNAHGGNPNAGGGSTNAHGGNPNAGGGSTNAHGGNLNAAGGSTNAHGGNPAAGGSNPNAGGGISNAQGTIPNAHGSGSGGQG
jgi:RNA polymerase sigma factor (sigma-70 family)